jgi:hypothetical protein
MSAKAAAVTRVGTAAWKWFWESSRGGTVVLGNHPNSVRHALGTATRSDVNEQADVLGVDTHALVLENSFNLA